MDNSQIDLKYEDYAQSANALFHFVQEAQYLDDILQKRALTPRYCIEDMSYLGLQVNGVPFPNVAVLQKCFCDIPFHKLMVPSEIDLIECDPTPNEQEKQEILRKNTHPKFYGEYGIALSKEWGEKNQLQPVQYINYDTSYTDEFSEAFSIAAEEENLPIEVANNITPPLNSRKHPGAGRNALT